MPRKKSTAQQTLVYKKDLAYCAQFVQDLPNAVVITDKKGIICHVNPAWERLTGYSFLEVQGKSPNILNTGKTPKSVFIKLWQTLSKGEAFSTDKVINRRKDGTEFAIYSTTFPVKKGKTILFYTQILRDITQSRSIQNKIKESEKQLKQILETIDDYAIFRMDKTGKIQSWNTGAEKMTGYTEEEILGKNFSLFYTKDDIKQKKPQYILQKTAKSGHYEEESLRKKKDGSLFWADIIIEPLRGKRGAITGFVKVVRDISERVALEEQKDTFIATASHELKTPITVLKSYVQVLEKKLEKEENPQTLELIRTIVSQTNSLTELIKDLLDVSYAESGKLTLDSGVFSMQELAKKVIDHIQITANSHTISLEGQVLGNVIGDKKKTEEILTNLLTNAIKYSPQADKVIVGLSQNSTHAIIMVKDFGLGISGENKKHIFDKFYRIKEKGFTAIQGYGLGLHIASELAKKQGGKLQVKSTLHKGSTFSFSVPLATVI